MASFLVNAVTNPPVAIFLDGQFRFSCMKARAIRTGPACSCERHVEIDEFSLLDPSQGQPQGALVRKTYATFYRRQI